MFGNATELVKGGGIIKPKEPHKNMVLQHAHEFFRFCCLFLSSIRTWMLSTISFEPSCHIVGILVVSVGRFLISLDAYGLLPCVWCFT